MGQLLLRSNPTQDDNTRLEVLFQGVKELSLPTQMDELHVRFEIPGVYLLTGKGWSGSVHASAMRVAQDEGSYTDPSPLWMGGVGGDR